jgi:protein-tyrosine phosphatase
VNFDFITPEIAVGQKIDSLEFAEALRAAGISHVLNLFAGDRETFWTGPVLYLAQEDDGTPRHPEQICAAVNYALPLIDEGTTSKLYIHCQWGLGRAPSTCYAILRMIGISREDAASLINRRRPRCAKWGWEQYIPSIEQAIS